MELVPFRSAFRIPSYELRIISHQPSAFLPFHDSQPPLAVVAAK
jgi:hypothetical protein